jgi:hypothetical protein
MSYLAELAGIPSDEMLRWFVLLVAAATRRHEMRIG